MPDFKAMARQGGELDGLAVVRLEFPSWVKGCGCGQEGYLLSNWKLGFEALIFGPS